MMMEMFLDEQKARKYNINIDECYLEVDRFFEKRGVKKVEKGVYKGTKDNLFAIVKAQWELPKTPWFLKIVDSWYFRYVGDTIECREDALESYYRIFTKNNDYKNAKSY